MLMNIDVKPGKYVIAVSGGVDSMVLLDLLAKKSDIEVIVAHYDHGVRNDSHKDRELVKHTAETMGLQFECVEGNLGADASEERARNARYDFLHTICDRFKAVAIITAHHQDDLIETVFINLLRGTGRKGLTSLKSTDRVVRPLLSVEKAELMLYANEHKIKWREDSTNTDTSYLRNYVRRFVIPKLSIEQKRTLISNVEKLQIINTQTDEEIANYLQLEKTETIDIRLVNMLNHTESCEVMAGWLRLNGIKDFDKKTIERLVIASKTKAPGTSININKGNYLYILHTSLTISSV